jgi:hypothetical protein
VAKTKKIEPRTKRFVELHKELSDKKLMPTHEVLAGILGFERKQSITEIIKLRQNIDEDKWKVFKEYFGIKGDHSPEYSLHEKPSPEAIHSIDYKEKYYALLEKENAVKDKTIEKLSLAVDNIQVIDSKVEELKTTVYDLKDKWKDYEPTILGLREFVTGEFAALKKLSHEEVAAALSIKVEEQRKKVEQSYIQKD